MTKLSAIQGKYSVVFILNIYSPVQTTGKLMHFIEERCISVESLQLYISNKETNTAIILVYCLLERGRSNHTQSLMKKLPGIIDIEVLEGKGTKEIQL